MDETRYKCSDCMKETNKIIDSTYHSGLITGASAVLILVNIVLLVLKFI